MLRFGSHKHTLETRNSKFRHELYKSNDGQARTWQFTGFVTHSLKLRKTNEALGGLDEAVEALKNNMASIEQDREARK